MNTYQAFGYTCDGTETELAECTRRGSICAADSVEHAVAISCGAGGSGDDDIVGAYNRVTQSLIIIMIVYVSCEELRLVGGNSCQGRLEVRIAPSTVFGQACNLNTGNNEAMVICNQLPGCSTVGAQRVDPTQ